MMKQATDLTKRHQPSEACGCAACVSYCLNLPGLWTVAQCRAALEAGLGAQMMLRLPPGKHGILSPALRGCEGRLLDRTRIGRGCTFLQVGLCALHSNGHKPLECRVTHHTKEKQSKACHMAIVAEWDSPEGAALVREWVDSYLASDERWYFDEQLPAGGVYRGGE